MAVHYGPTPAGWDGSSSRSSYVTSNLVFHVDFGNSNSYAGSGTDVNDLVGEFDMTLVNTPTYSTADGGKMTFDGGSEYATWNDHGSSHALDITGACTNEVWVKCISVATHDTLFCKGKIHTSGTDSNIATFAWTVAAGGSGQSNSYRHTWKSSLVSSDRRLINTMCGSTPSNAWEGTYSHSLTDWAHLVATFDGTNGSNNHKVYYNGNLAHQNTNNVAGQTHNGNLETNDLDLRFAHSDGRNSGQYTANASFGLARVYNKALSLSEIQTNYDADKTRFGL